MKKIFLAAIILINMLAFTANAQLKLSFAAQIQTAGNANEVLLTGSAAFVNETSRVGVYSIDNPESPVYLTGISYQNCSVRVMAARGNYLFVAYENVMRVYNISDLKNITDVAGYRHGVPYPTAIVTDSNYVYLAAHSNGLCIISASDTVLKNHDSSTALTAVYTGGFGIITAMQKNGKYLYMGTNSSGAVRNGALIVADVSNPYMPAENGYYQLPHFDDAAKFLRISQLAVSGDYVYVSTNDSTVNTANCSNGVYIFNAAKAKSSTAAVMLDAPAFYNDLLTALPRRISDIKIYGSIMYMADQDGRSIKALSIENPVKPKIISKTNTQSGNINGMRTITVKGKYMYAADNDAGFAVYKLSDMEICSTQFVAENSRIYSTNGGKVAFKAVFNNYSAANERFDGDIMLALYSDGKLCKVTVKSGIVIPKNTNNAEITTDEIAVPAGKYTAKAFIVKDCVIPLKKAEFINNVEIRNAYYVDAQNGDDSAEGSEAYPVKTVNTAKNMANAVKNDVNGDIHIYLKSGRYFLDGTQQFTEDDSGENGHSIIYEGIGNAEICSGTKITGWSLYDAAENIYAADSKGRRSREMYVNGTAAVRAKSSGGLTDVKVDSGEYGMTSADTEIAGWKNVQDIEMVFREIWTNPRVSVKSATVKDGRLSLEMRQNCWAKARNNGQPSVKAPWYYENAYELLDSDGEFYIDGSKVFYKPRAGENMKYADVILPSVDTLFAVNGETAENHVHGLKFKNLKFLYTSWEKPSEDGGYVDGQDNYSADGYDIYVPPAAVEICNADNIEISGCTFTNLASLGIKAETAVQNLNIIGNTFYNIGGGAMCIGFPGTALMPDIVNPENSFEKMDAVHIENNYIHDVSAKYRGSAAVSLGFLSNSDILHNEIANIPYSGFHIGWGWTLVETSNTQNLNVKYNYIHDLMDPQTGLYDGGAIYTLGGTNGNNYISENYIKNQMNACAALYADNGTSGYTYEKNVIDEQNVTWNGETPLWALGNTGAHDISFKNNFTTTGRYSMRGENMEVNDTVVCEDASWNAVAAGVIANAGLQADYKKSAQAIEFVSQTAANSAGMAIYKVPQ